VEAAYRSQSPGTQVIHVADGRRDVVDVYASDESLQTIAFQTGAQHWQHCILRGDGSGISFLLASGAPIAIRRKAFEADTLGIAKMLHHARQVIDEVCCISGRRLSCCRSLPPEEHPLTVIQ
jgi:hypothetical protein